MNKRPKPEKTWSARSQRTILEHRRLEGELEKCDALIFCYGRLVAEFEQSVECGTAMAVSGDGAADAFLPERLGF